MQVYPIFSENKEDRDQMAVILTNALKRYQLDEKVKIATNEAYKTVFYLVIPGCLNDEENHTIELMRKKIKSHLEKTKEARLLAEIKEHDEKKAAWCKLNYTENIGDGLVRKVVNGTPYINNVHEDIWWKLEEVRLEQIQEDLAYEREMEAERYCLEAERREAGWY